MNDKETIKPLNLPLAIFILFQLAFIILILATIPNLFPSDEIPGGVFNPATEVKIENLSELLPNLPASDKKLIENSLFGVISANTRLESFSSEDLKARIIPETFKNVYFARENVNFVSATIDLPTNLKQSYELYYRYSSDSENKNIDPALPGVILCPTGSAILYPETSCTNIYTTTREQLVSDVINLFDFDYFSLSIPSSDPTKINITPVTSAPLDEITKTNYINETKEAVSSLGVSPDLFNYHIITSSDINYLDPWRD